jgi:hypothetical protein
VSDKKGKIGTIDEFMNLFQDEWLLLEVLETSDEDVPTVGRIIAHSRSRDEIYMELKGSTHKDMALIFSGDIPKKGTLVMF